MPAGCITFKNCLFHDADTFFFNVKQTFSVVELESGGNNAREGQEKKKEREHQGKILQKYKL